MRPALPGPSVTPCCSTASPVYTAGGAPARRSSSRRYAGHRGRPRRQDHLARSRPALVGYPIVALPQPMDVVGYVRRVERMLIEVCTDLGLATERVAGRSGSGYQGERRAGSEDRSHRHPGVRGVTMHGFALRLRLRPVLVRPDRALRDPRRHGHIAVRRAGSRRVGRRSPARRGTPPAESARPGASRRTGVILGRPTEQMPPRRVSNRGGSAT